MAVHHWIESKKEDCADRQAQCSQAVTAVPYESTKQNLYLKNEILHPVQIADLQWTCRIGILYRKDIPLNKAQTFLLNQIRNMFAAE